MVALLLSLPQLLVHDIFNITDRLAKFPLEKAFRRARLAPRDRATLSSGVYFPCTDRHKCVKPLSTCATPFHGGG